MLLVKYEITTVTRRLTLNSVKKFVSDQVAQKTQGEISVREKINEKKKKTKMKGFERKRKRMTAKSH